MKYLLGIESTAHTFGLGLVNEEKKIIANIRDMYKTEKGGIIPVEAAKHHTQVCDLMYEKILNENKIEEKDIFAISFSQGPGLAPCLLAGIRFAKKLAEKLKVPLVPVNHCIAHLEIGDVAQQASQINGEKLSNSTGCKDPVLLYASGANTQIIAYEAGKYRVFGETLDVGIGNFIDTFARYAGLGFPGGPKIMEFARTGKYVELPYNIKGMDVAFSGMLTKLRQLFENKKEKLEDLSFSLQETAFAMLVEAAERAIAHTGKKELLLGGGVACNTRLQEMCKIMCEERGVKFFCPSNELLTDNPAMIGFLGLKMYNAGIFYPPEQFDKLDIAPRQRTDEVKITWK